MTSLYPKSLSSGSIPECLHTPVDTCQGHACVCVCVCAWNVQEVGGSDFGTGGLSTERVLKKRCVGAGKLGWLSSQTGLADGIFGTLWRKGRGRCITKAGHQAPPTPRPAPAHPPPAWKPPGSPHQQPPPIKPEMRKDWSDLQTPGPQL